MRSVQIPPFRRACGCLLGLRVPAVLPLTQERLAEIRGRYEARVCVRCELRAARLVPEDRKAAEAMAEAEIRGHFATMAKPGLCRRCGRIGPVTYCATAVIAGELRPGDPVPDAVMDQEFYLCEGCFVAWRNE